MCSKEIGLFVQKFDNCSKLHNQYDWRELCNHSSEHENLHFENTQDIHMSSENYEEIKQLRPRFGFARHSVLN